MFTPLEGILHMLHIERAAEFEPTWLDGLLLWARADSLDDPYVPLENGDVVTLWRDESGNGNDLIAPSGANGPTFVTNQINGLPVVKFNKANNHYLMTNLDFGSPFYVYTVMKYTSSDIQTEIFFSVGMISADYSYIGMGKGLNKHITATKGSIYYQAHSLTLNEFQVYSEIHGSTYPRNHFATNGVRLAHNYYAADQPDDGEYFQLFNFDTVAYIGCGANAVGTPSYFCDLELAEIIIFDQEMPLTHQQAIEYYLGSKYGISFDQGREPDRLEGLRLWLKADQISGYANGDRLESWEDQSGNGFDATSNLEDPYGGPFYHTNAVNGLPAVRFDYNYYIDPTIGQLPTSGDSMTGDIGDLDTPFSIFAVCYNRRRKAAGLAPQMKAAFSRTE